MIPIGLHVKQVVGYPDNPAIYVAIERGEVQGRTVDLSSLKAVKPEWLKPENKFRVLVQFARATRHPEFPDVPTARELAKNEASRALIELAELPYAMSRPIAAPPNVPAERAKALQEAFLAVYRDPQYLSDAAELKLDASPIDGDEVLHAIDAMAARRPSFSNMRASFLPKPKEAVSATMNRSIERVLTTHVGSLPRPADILDALEAEQQGRPVDEKIHAALLRRQ